MLFTIKLLKVARAVAALYAHEWGSVSDEVLQKCVDEQSSYPISNEVGYDHNLASRMLFRHRYPTIRVDADVVTICDDYTFHFACPVVVSWNLFENSNGISYSVNVEMIGYKPHLSASFGNGSLCFSDNLDQSELENIRTEFLGRITTAIAQ